MEKTTLFDGNGFPYEREIPHVLIFGFGNYDATEHLKKQTGIEFEKVGNYYEGHPQTWEQFSKIFLTYNFLTHDICNAYGNMMILRLERNVPLSKKLYYELNGERVIGVE